MQDKGWICLHRKFIDWEWYSDANTMRLFIHCLLLANHKTQKWRGTTIKAGSFISGRIKLAQDLNLSESQIRTSLNKLKLTNEITIQPCASYSIITVNNWKQYQKNNQQNNQQITNKQPTNNQRITTNNNDNKERYINISLSQEIFEISKEEREILKKFAKKNGAKHITPYVNTLIKSGDYLAILQEEKEKIQALKAKEVIPPVQEAEETEEEKQKAFEQWREKVRQIK